MLDDTLHEQLAGWVRPLTSLPAPDIRVLRRRARRRGARRVMAAAAVTATVAVTAVGISASLPGTGRPAGGRPVDSALSWPAAPGTWNRGAWEPAGPLPAPDAGPDVAPYILIQRLGGVIQVRDVLSSVTTIATISSPAGQYVASVASAGDDRTFVLQAAIGGQQDGNGGYPDNPATMAFDELRLGADGQEQWLHVLFTVPARGVELGFFALSQDASMLAYQTNNGGLETVSLATGTGRSWPPVGGGGVDSLSWAGDRTLAFEWDTGDDLHAPGAGVRVLDVTAPGTLLSASRLVVAYGRYCAYVGVCWASPVITPDGSAVIVPRAACLRACATSVVMSAGVFTDSVVEYSTRTGRAIATVAPPVTWHYPGAMCTPVWTDPSGVQVVTSCGHGVWYDRGRVRGITLHMPMNGTDLLAFAWQPGSPQT